MAAESGNADVTRGRDSVRLVLERCNNILSSLIPMCPRQNFAHERGRSLFARGHPVHPRGERWRSSYRSRFSWSGHWAGQWLPHPTARGAARGPAPFWSQNRVWMGEPGVIAYRRQRLRRVGVVMPKVTLHAGPIQASSIPCIPIICGDFRGFGGTRKRTTFFPPTGSI